MTFRAVVLCLAFGAGMVLTGRGADGQLFERTDPQREIEFGRQVAVMVERELPLSRDPVMRNRVRRIGDALVRAMPEKAYPYEFKVLEVKDFNAFCLPGGFMYVYEGLLTRLGDDDAVAFVMAHEITHASHRHWKRMVDKMQGPALIAILAGTVLGSPDVAQIAAMLVEAQYSREQEDDADEGGMRLAWAAGYAPWGGVEAAKVMEDLEKDVHVPVYLRSHPPARDRVRTLEALANELSRRPRVQPSPANGGQASAAPGERDIVDDPPESAAACPWIPLSVGTRWVYAVSNSGGVTAPANLYSVNVVARIPTTRGGIWRVVYSLPGAKSVTHQWLTTANGIWWRVHPEDSGSAWSLQFDFAGTRTGGAAVWKVSRAGPVETPCGTFTDVLKLSTGNGETEEEVWFARGVGMVKRLSRGGRVTELLVKYCKPVTVSDEVEAVAVIAGGQ